MYRVKAGLGALVHKKGPHQIFIEFSLLGLDMLPISLHNTNEVIVERINSKFEKLNLGRCLWERSYHLYSRKFFLCGTRVDMKPFSALLVSFSKSNVYDRLAIGIIAISL